MSRAAPNGNGNAGGNGKAAGNGAGALPMLTKKDFSFIKDYIAFTRRQMGVIDLGQLVYLRSELYVADVRRSEPGYEPPVPPVFGVKEGRIAKASRGREPVYLFSALQRQLGYPEVPKPHQRDDLKTRLDAITAKLKELEMRLRLAEGELRGSIDLSQFGKPDILKREDEDE